MSDIDTTLNIPAGSVVDRVFARLPDGTPNVMDRRANMMGSGLPPYNSTGKPPVSITLIDSCYTGQTNAFSSFLHPMANLFSYPSTENQAYLGWVDESIVEKAYNFAFFFWGALVHGSTVDKARFEALKEYTGNPQLPEEEVPTYIKLWGDHHTRLKGVYTGNNATQAASVWKRHL